VARKGPRPLPTEVRFFRSVVKTNTCWLWQGHLHPKGYGHIIHNGKWMRVHRYAWIRVHGAIPQNMLVCHKCDVRHCVNPDHLFLGTAKDNSEDMVRKGRSARGERSGWYTHYGEMMSGCVRGEQHKAAKLTDAIVTELRIEAAQGVSFKELAKRSGVDPAVISRAVRGENWAHVKQQPVPNRKAWSRKKDTR
jgi:hypothetical protein